MALFSRGGSIKTKFTLEGLSDLKRALDELPKATAKNILLRNLKKVAQPIADTESAMAPIGPTGGLAQSPIVSTKLTKRQRKLNPKQSAVEVYVGPTAHPKSIQTEFGNSHQAAEPHLRPAWDQNVGSDGGQVLANFTKLTAEDIERARARFARKAEREAAKMGR